MKQRRNRIAHILFKGRYIIALAVGQVAALAAMGALITLTDVEEPGLSRIDVLTEDSPIEAAGDNARTREEFLEALSYDGA